MESFNAEDLQDVIAYGDPTEIATARDEYSRSALKDALPIALTGTLTPAPSSKHTYPWSLHACFLDEDCSEYGRLWRLNFSVPAVSAALAFAPSARFSFLNADGSIRASYKTVSWAKTCRNVTMLTLRGELVDSFYTCSRKDGHKGRCTALSEKVSRVIIKHI